MVSLWGDCENSVRVVRLSEPDEITALVRLFEEVAQAEGWQPGSALDRWRDCSVFFGLELQGQLAGGVQVVVPGQAGPLPCQEIWPEVEVGCSGHCAHVGVLALEKTYRGDAILLWRLVAELWRWCVAERIGTLFLEVTPRVLPLYRRLGWPLQIRGEPRLHWGEECYLCSLEIAEVAEALLRRSEHCSYLRQVVAQALRMALPTAQEQAFGPTKFPDC